jgi:hypothetical protein
MMESIKLSSQIIEGEVEFNEMKIIWYLFDNW